MEQDRLIPLVLLSRRERWLTFLEIRKLHEIYALGRLAPPMLGQAAGSALTTPSPDGPP